MKDTKIKVDKMLEKIPNKYELSILCGKLAREKFLEGIPKHKIMEKVFEEIIEKY